MYCSRTQLCELFSVSRTTVWRDIKGIESEIGKRYNQYAILDDRINEAVYADYHKYHKALEDPRTRARVPAFDAWAYENCNGSAQL